MLRKAREARGLSRTAAAKNAGLSESWWRKTENGETVIDGEVTKYRPGAETLSRAAQSVGLNPGKILHAGGYPGYETEPTWHGERGDLHTMIDALPDSKLPAARAYLLGLSQS